MIRRTKRNKREPNKKRNRCGGEVGEEGNKERRSDESCNAGNDVVEIPPGKAHHLWVQYQVKKQ